MRYWILVWMVIVTASPLMAQSGPVARERIEAQRVAFITQRLRLTPDEAARFWPVYNEYKDGLRDIRDDLERPDLDNISEEEASKVLEIHLQNEYRKLELKRNMITRLRTIVSAKKILMLQAAENAFNRELLRRVQANRRP